MWLPADGAEMLPKHPSVLSGGAIVWGNQSNAVLAVIETAELDEDLAALRPLMNLGVTVQCIYIGLTTSLHQPHSSRCLHIAFLRV